ncbi:filamentous hemagglutinin N-terminal domain-containing protein [Fischerella thermalis]|uniref:Filamentous hemagglutinin n=1 Tax=Fischerella thermalis CCMEE 5318 TaxID=2019666 RepID=A0A2N6L9H2_9CYAN|nr:filamentous hemagglutinin N-terminal domain-containing protein [Fischerella thermalis]PMB18971.1 filamentous hemagglutinin [Fischerella thermalis CCMEE 5318]
MLPILDSFYLKNQKRSLVCNQNYQKKYNWRSLIWFALPLITLGSFAPINKATAQLTPDTSLGAESSVVNPNVVDGIDLITGGATRGSNLFHSFQDFNVDAGRGAYFDNPTGITDILTRVTGGNRSNIQGILGVLGNANLFLINPNGIDFGPNAILDLRGGSFFGSTADSVLFDNFEFSASNLQPVPQLTINIPIGLRFRDNPGSITNQSVVQNINGDFFGLIVEPGETFALVGGDVIFNNGTVLTPGGRVELGGLKQAGTVGLNPDGSLSFPNGVTRADVTINNGSTVAVLGDGGGSIAINARNFDISGGSNLFAGILSGFGNPDAQAGDIVINTTDKFTITGNADSSAEISNLVQNSAIGNAGNVIINTKTLEGTGNFAIGSASFGQGNAGRVDVTATDKIFLQGLPELGSGFGSVVGPFAIGSANDVVINTPSLTLENFAQIATSTTGSGNAGNIRINASESVSVNSGSIMQAATYASGNAGDIIIDAANADVVFNAARISTSVVGQSNILGVDLVGTGLGGDIVINARSLSLQNSARVFTDTTGIVGDKGLPNAGNINITTGSLFATDGSQLNSSTFSQGNAGDVIINAPNGTVSFKGTNNQGLPSAIFSNVETGGDGEGGDIDITANSLFLTDGGQLNTFIRAGGRGTAGDVKLNISDSFTISGVSQIPTPEGIFASSGINSNVLFGATGDAGNIDITTGSLFLSSAGKLNSNTFGEGNAGDINITTGSLFVSGGGQLNSNTFSTGNAGNVTINAPNGIVSFDGKDSQGNPSAVFSSVEAGSTGTGGDIIINANSLFLTNGAQLNTVVRNNLSTQPDRVIKAGNVQLNVSDRIDISGVSDIRQSNGVYSRSGIFSSVEQGAIGNASNIDITTGSLFVTDGGQIFASTAGRGDAGNITITARDIVSFDGADQIVGFPSAAFSNVEIGGIGKGGEINITARSLSLTNGGQLNTFVRGLFEPSDINDLSRAEIDNIFGLFNLFDIDIGGIGNAGNVKLNVSDGITITGISENGVNSGIFSNVETGGRGNSGNIEIITKGPLVVKDGGRLFASTSSLGDAGGIKINANSFLLDNAQLFTNSDVENSQAGNIEITTAKDIRLNNQALIAADTRGGQGNVTLRSRDLILRRNSNITTNATGTATGGNITIDTGNLVALENSDISADAKGGPGGSVFIRADAIFGTQFRRQRTPESDITATGASPDLSGTVRIDTADVDPSQGLVELPENPTDPSNQIAQNPCQKGSGSSFIITGRGGLSSSPNNNFSSDNIRVDLLQPVGSSRNSQSATINQPTNQSTSKQIVPAQGWVFNEKGEVVLTAYDPNASNPQRTTQVSVSCPAPF